MVPAVVTARSGKPRRSALFSSSLAGAAQRPVLGQQEQGPPRQLVDGRCWDDVHARHDTWDGDLPTVCSKFDA